MPNQLAKDKRRKSLAEHEAVLAVLEEIARNERTSSMALMRQALREVIKNYVDNTDHVEQLRSVAMKLAPKPSQDFSSTKQLSQFKSKQREFDEILLELHLAEPERIEASNSIVSPNCKIRVLELEP